MSDDSDIAFKENRLRIGVNPKNNYAGLVPDAILRGNFSGKPTDKDLLLKEVGIMLEAQELGASEYAQLHHARIAADSAASSAIKMEALKEVNTERRVVTSLSEYEKQQAEREGFMRRDQ